MPEFGPPQAESDSPTPTITAVAAAEWRLPA
jgi:hypothetical protein